jgi:carboxyl-terminal processing protease
MRAGLRPGDALTRIAGTPTEGLNLSGVMKLLRGAPDPVVLSVTRAGAVREVTLRREASAGAAERKPWSVMLPRGVGYLRLEAFYPSDGPALREALRTLVAAKATRLVLDLRDNPGGDGATALDVVGALAGELDCGTGLEGVGPKLFDGAIAVLVDEGSASAAELVSGALQAAGRAKLFGTRTFGKGLLHADLPLSDGSTLLVSLGRLVTTKGRDISSEGLEPDVRVATPENPVSREVAPPVSAIIADPQVAAAL